MDDERIAAVRTFEIRTVLDHHDLTEIEKIQREIWGPDDVVPAPQLRAVEHAGGQLAAAFEGGRMLGFSYGFLAAPHGRGMTGAGLHSHMVAVRSEGRGLGVGRSLKWHQREWALGRGIGWISWTFDPLQARNARLNLEHLGAKAYDYLVDFYGPMGGPLGGGQSSDRLLALWELTSQRVKRLQPSTPVRPGVDPLFNAAPSPAPAERAEAWAVTASTDDAGAEPLIAAVPEGAEVVRVAVPPDVTRLMTEDPDLARRWRTAVGVSLTRLLGAGYVVVGFRDAAYVLELERPSIKAAIRK